MGNRSWARAAVVEISRQEQPLERAAPPDSSPPADSSPLYAAALLKVAVELRRPEPRPLEETIERILAGTPIDREAFRGYLQRNFSLLRRA
jgi:hypothetical protein